MDSYEFEVKLQSVLLVVEAIAYLALAVWCLTRRDGRWTTVVGGGSALVGAMLGLSAAAAFEQIFLDSTHIYEEVYFHDHIQAVFTLVRVAGVVLLVAGFLLSRRTPAAAPGGSIYGS